jgi:hypothetical protein
MVLQSIAQLLGAFSHIRDWRNRGSYPHRSSNGRTASVTLLQENPDDGPKPWSGIMKALIAALALVTLISAPSFAQRGYYGGAQYNNSSPASPNFGGNGY